MYFVSFSLSLSPEVSPGPVEQTRPSTNTWRDTQQPKSCLQVQSQRENNSRF